MALKDIGSSAAVLKAIAEYDSLGQEAFLAKYGFKKSREFVLVHEGKPYDSKAILGAAHGMEFPEQGPLKFNDFTGGQPTIKKLEELGFSVESRPDSVDAGSGPRANAVDPWVRLDEECEVRAEPSSLGPSIVVNSVGAGRKRFKGLARLLLALSEQAVGITQVGYHPSHKDFQALEVPSHADIIADPDGAGREICKQAGRVDGGNGGSRLRIVLGGATLDRLVTLIRELELASQASPSEAETWVASMTKVSIFDFLKTKQLTFPRELVTSYLLSLQTKPFVILSGISGTGKTKLAEYVAEWAGSAERDVEGPPPPPPAEDVWQYKVSPYTYRHRKIVVARAFEAQFMLADFGSKPVVIGYQGAQFEGTVGKVRTAGRELHELRLGVPLTDLLKKQVPLGSLLNIRVVKEIESGMGEVAIERHDAPLLTKRETFVRHDFVSVRPDWLDNKGVLGFFNLLSERYMPTPFLKRLIAAFRDEQGDGEPHFITLDEMNLARVEHYFSDLLSVTESRKPGAAGVKQEMLHLHDQERCEPILPLEENGRPVMCSDCPATLEKMKMCQLHPEGVAMVPPRMPVPTNVFITGTVNVDETTHMFSPKVLDRANVIEFNEVRLGGVKDADDVGFQLTGGTLPLRGVVPAVSEHYSDLRAPIRAQIEALHALLEPFHLHFGYRVANEIGLWLANAEEYVGAKHLQTALDLQVLQKVLPKLHGTKQKLFEPLWALLFFASGTAGGSSDFKAEFLPQMKAALEGGKAFDVATKKASDVPAPLPRSARKLLRMVKRLNEQGFVSFIE